MPVPQNIGEQIATFKGLYTTHMFIKWLQISRKLEQLGIVSITVAEPIWGLRGGLKPPL